MTTAQNTMGQLLTSDMPRDAIHIALFPVVAAVTLKPGQAVGVDGTGNAPIGIVDPFLKTSVKAGQRFWMFLYPNTITSLRHDWTHPAVEAAVQSNAVSVSEQWLRDFCDGYDKPSYHEMMACLLGESDEDAYPGVSIQDGYILVRGSDAHGDIPTEFWTHAEIVTGKRFTNRPDHFGCSC